MIGSLLDGRYRIISALGAGGFGATYAAEDTRRPGHPRCVVKQLKPVSTDPNYLLLARRLFEKEAETLERLGSHEQIPRLLAYFEENQEFYLVQEFIDGHTLDVEVQLGQRLAESKVIQLLHEILSILVFVHAQGVIHRDIKPENLIRRKQDNKLVLIDFGAVKEVRLNQLVNTMLPTVAIGTPGYMPSEQSSGKPRPGSDIYAVGMIGIQALTGMLPSYLREDEDGEVMWRSMADVSDAFASVLDRMVRHYFKHRYQSATDVLITLEGLANFSRSGQDLPQPVLPTYPAIPNDSTAPCLPDASPTKPSSTVISHPDTDAFHPETLLPKETQLVPTTPQIERPVNKNSGTTVTPPEKTVTPIDSKNEIEFKKTTSGNILILRDQAQQFQTKFAASLTQKTNQKTNQPIVFHVHGIGGVGKTTLLQELQQQNLEKAYFAWVYFDVHQGVDTPLKLMVKLYEEVEKVTKPGFWQQEVFPPPDPFISLYRKYQETLHSLETEPVTGNGTVSPEQINTVKQLVKLGVSIVGRVMPASGITTPTLEKLADSSVDAATLLLVEKDRWQQLLQKHRATRKKRELQALMLEPLNKLTQAFVQGLIRKTKNRPIVLVFDTFEQANPDINSWLQYLLANTDLRLHKIRLIIAGRYSLLKTEGWRRLQQNWQLIYENSLNRFNEQQTEFYLTQLNISQDSQIRGAFRTTKGLPYYLNWIREQKDRGIEVDFSQGHDEISRVLLQGLNTTQKKVVQLAACCRWFDQLVLQYLIERKGKKISSNLTESESNHYFDWLINRDFVKVAQFRYCLDDVARDIFRISLWQEDQDFFHQIHHLLADYFEQRAKRMSPDRPIVEQIQNSDWQICMAESYYHRFFAHPTTENREILQNLFRSSPLQQSEVVKNTLTAIMAEADIAEHPLLRYEAKQTLTVIRNTVISNPPKM